MMTLNPMPGPSRVPAWKAGRRGLNVYLCISGDGTLGLHMDSGPDGRILSPGTMDGNGLTWDKAPTAASLSLRSSPDLKTWDSSPFSSGRAAWLGPDTVLEDSLEAPTTRPDG